MKVRKTLGLNQKDFAEKVFNISRSSYAKWEQGVEEPPVGTEKRIREYLKAEYNIVLRKYGVDDEQYTSKVTGLTVAAGLIGAALFGPVGAVGGSVVGAGASTQLNSKKGFDVNFEIGCPWCNNVVNLSSVDKYSDYICPHCDEEFRFSEKRKRAIKIAQK